MTSLAVKIALYYALFSVAWIMGSDQVVAFVFPDNITQIQTYKGWFFVLLTSLLIYGVLHRELIKRQRVQSLQLRQAKDFDNMVQRMQDIYYRTDMYGNLELASPSVLNVLGFKPEEIIGRPLADLHVSAATRDSIHQQIIEAAGKAVTVEAPIRRKDGIIVWMSASSFLRFDENGQPCGIEGIARDITVRKQLEDRLRLMSESLNNAQKIAHLGNYDWDPLTGDMWWSDELHHMLQTPDNEGPLSHESLLAYVHEDDRDFVRAIMEDARDNGRGFMVEHRMVSKTGQVRNVYQEAKISIGGPKEPARISAIVQDVTEQVKAQKALEEAKSQAEHYLEIANTILVTLDINGDITMINKRGCDMVGYAKEELIGKNWFELLIPIEERFHVREEFANAMQHPEKQATTTYENHIVTRKGQLRLIRWNNAYLKDGDRKAIGVIASGEDITDQRDMEDRMNFLASHDTLTHLPNRSELTANMQKALALSNRLEIRCGILFLDLDGFKEVNDDLGHHVGDQVLRMVADRLAKSVRESDTPARFGGDEFVILLQGQMTEDGCCTTAEKLITEISRPYILNEHRIEIGASIGIAVYPDHGKDVTELLRNADKAMYRAKKAGKGQYAVALPLAANSNQGKGFPSA